ncbi:MAG TPA: glycine zipper domain-containing protein [Gemmataceae bacterium]|jgi:outer membrane lipoprotein SlyB|nr:glycine zipper domain-containing protein [Gemmataceae bacterium]
MMRNNLRLLLAATGLWALTGCESMNKTEQGAVGGGVLGGTAGALIGSATGHTGAGAAIGAGLGAVSGGLIGNSIEESEHKAKAVAASAAVPAPGQLSLSDIAQMSQQQLSDGVIISQIRTTRSVFVLSPEQLAWLKQQGVSDGVVMEMQQTASRVPPPHARVYARPVYVEPVYVAPPPPVGVGFSYTRFH